MTKTIEDGLLKAMINFIHQGAKLIKDERVQKAYEKVHESVHNGYENMADNEEKKAWLNYVLCDQCYRLGYYLWRHELLNEGIEAQLRTFMLPEDAIEIAREFGEADREADVELSKKHMEIEKRRKGIEIFQSVLAGDTLEVAKQKMEEYEQRQKQVLENLDKQPQAPAMQ